MLVKVEREGKSDLDAVIKRIYDRGMRKTADVDLEPRSIELVNRCPKCGGRLKAMLLVGLGALRPQKQTCLDRCGFEKDIRKVQHG